MDNVNQAKVELEKIKMVFNAGIMSYDDAKTKSLPYIECLNKRMKEIAREHKVAYHPITFIGYMR
jgi:hypothetical protein